MATVLENTVFFNSEASCQNAQTISWFASVLKDETLNAQELSDVLKDLLIFLSSKELKLEETLAEVQIARAIKKSFLAKMLALSCDEQELTNDSRSIQ